MKLNEETQNKVLQTNKREQLIDAEFGLIDVTGKLSGNIKDILYSSDIEIRKKGIKNVSENLEELMVYILSMSDSLRLDINKIIKEKIDL